jgi:ribosomal protein S7
VIREISLPVSTAHFALRGTERSLQTEAPEDIDLLAERTGLQIRKNILRRGGDAGKKVSAKEVFYNSLAKINAATGLNFRYEIMEEPEKGKEYVAVTSRFFSYIRRKEENR